MSNTEKDYTDFLEVVVGRALRLCPDDRMRQNVAIKVAQWLSNHASELGRRKLTPYPQARMNALDDAMGDRTENWKVNAAEDVEELTPVNNPSRAATEMHNPRKLLELARELDSEHRPTPVDHGPREPVTRAKDDPR